MMKLALGPLLYCWPRDTVLSFYRDAENWPVDVVYLGEVVCARRCELRAADWMVIADSLVAAGKEVVISTLALLEAEADLRMLRRLVAQNRFLIEANDMSAVQLAAEAGVPFVIGPHINVYNAETLAALARCGARRWVAPMETSRELLVRMQQERPKSIETELFVFGRLPLAFSARCFTARSHDLGKDNCGFTCRNDPDGLMVRTREGQELLVFNGIQTQSARVFNLLPALTDIGALNVDLVRVSPGASGTAEIVHAFREHLQGHSDWQASCVRLAGLSGMQFCDGYWHGRPGMEALFGELAR